MLVGPDGTQELLNCVGAQPTGHTGAGCYATPQLHKIHAVLFFFLHGIAAGYNAIPWTLRGEVLSRACYPGAAKGGGGGYGRKLEA